MTLTSHPFQILLIGSGTDSEAISQYGFEEAQLADFTRIDRAADAVSLLGERDFDCVLSVYPPDAEQTDTLGAVRQSQPDLPVVFVLTDEANAIDALNAGAAEYIRESVLNEHPDLLVKRILGAIEDEMGKGDRQTNRNDGTQLGDAISANPESGNRVAAAIVGNFPNGAVTLVDEDLRYKLAGGQLFETLPSCPDDVIGSQVGELSSGDRDVFVRTYKAALDGEETTTETEVNGKNLLIRAVPIEDETGSIAAAVGMTQDISERKQRELKLTQSREFLQDIQTVATVGGWEVDLGAETVRWSDEVYRIFGLPTDHNPTVEEALEFFHPEDTDTIKRAHEALTTEGEPYDLELRIETTEDTVRWVRTRGEPWRDDNGDIVGVRGTIQDITNRKAREQELRRKSRAIEAAPIGIVITDPTQADNPITYVNQEFSETSGYEPEEVIGRNCRFMRGENTDPETVGAIREAIDAPRNVSVEIRNYRKDGTEFWNHLEIAPVWDDDGDLLNFVGFQRDVTERVEYERELERSRNRYQTLAEHFPGGAVALVDEGLRYKTVGGDPIEDTETGELEGERVEEALSEELAEQLVPRYTAALDGETSTFEKSVEDTVYRFRIVPVKADDGSIFAAMGVSQDITDLKERERTLEKRERVLHELHVASREDYPPDSTEELAAFIVDFLKNAFEFSYISVKCFDEQEGVLGPSANWGSLQNLPLGPIEPGDNPLWNAYRTGNSAVCDCQTGDETCEVDAAGANQRLVVPVGDFGLIVVVTAEDKTFDSADVDLIEVLGANARVIFETLQRDQERKELEDTIEDQEESLAELSGVLEAIQGVQQCVTMSETKDELEEGVCSELLKTDSIDFAWIGRPQTSDGDLIPTARAGDRSGYLDAVLGEAGEGPMPAQHAAVERTSYLVENISEQVIGERWAKEALSNQFRSVLSVPLVYDDVLYGVLTVYSSTLDAFGTTYENLVSDVGSLVVTYSHILQQRYSSGDQFIELEFELTDSGYPLQRLATATGTRIEYETVLESRNDEVRLLATVSEGDPTVVIDRATELQSILDASRFGDDNSRQVRLTVQKPFLASVVVNHGGQLLEARSADTTMIRIAIPTTVSTRPLLDALTNRYQDIEMIAKRRQQHQTEQRNVELTDRQYEILNAAYHGGYFETPRGVTGEELAADFDISGPALYNHLQAAHRTILEQFF